MDNYREKIVRIVERELKRTEEYQQRRDEYGNEEYILGCILLENVPGLAPTSLLLLEQLRTIDRKRLRGYIGRISKEKMLEVDAALAISIGIGYPNERRTHNV